MMVSNMSTRSAEMMARLYSAGGLAYWRRQDIENQHVIDYDTLRPQLQTGDLLLSSGDFWISRLVRRLTNCPYSHVGFVVRVEQFDRVFVVESVELYGVRFFRLSQYGPRGVYSGQRPYRGKALIASWQPDFLSDEKRLELAQCVMDLIMHKYDYREIVINGLCLFLKVRNRRHNNSAYTCAELVDHVFSCCGLPFDKGPSGIASPLCIAAHPKLQFLARIK